MNFHFSHKVHQPQKIGWCSDEPVTNGIIEKVHQPCTNPVGAAMSPLLAAFQHKCTNLMTKSHTYTRARVRARARYSKFIKRLVQVGAFF